MIAAQRFTKAANSDTYNCPVESDNYSSGRRRYHWRKATTAAEPGIDLTKVPGPEIRHESKPVSIQVTDYNSHKTQFRTLSNPTLEGYLSKPRPAWATARWINVNGISMDVIQQLAIHHKLHPLAVEDSLHTSAKSKSEYFRQHLFVHLVVHTLANPSEPSDTPSALSDDESCDKSRTTTALEHGIIDPDVSESVDGHADGVEEPQTIPSFQRIQSHASLLDVLRHDESDDEDDRAREVVRELTKEYKVKLKVQTLSMFLLYDGTLITFFSSDGTSSLRPIFERLRSTDTLLRSSADASMLLQSLIDLVVDEALEVSDAFRNALTSLEAKVLVNPAMESVRHLHVLSGELLLLKRTLTPLLSLVHGIRNHDADPKASYIREGEVVAPKLISPMARVYLRDVLDHIDTLLSSFDLFSGIAQNLIDFTFNSMSFTTNESMKQLSLVTIFFLPLSFLTGYFGMNFETFSAIKQSDALFWKLGIPITASIAVLFLIEPITRYVKTVKRKVVVANTIVKRKQRVKHSKYLK